MREVRPRHRSPARRTSPCLVPPRGLVGVRARPVEGGGVGWLGTPAGTGRHAHRQPQAPPAPDDLIHVLLLCHYSNHSCEKGLAYGYSNSVHQKRVRLARKLLSQVGIPIDPGRCCRRPHTHNDGCKSMLVGAFVIGLFSPSDANFWAGQRVLLTGASSGLGASLARELTARGARLLARSVLRGRADTAFPHAARQAHAS